MCHLQQTVTGVLVAVDTRPCPAPQNLDAGVMVLAAASLTAEGICAQS